MNLSILTVFLKNRNFTSKTKRSKVTDYAVIYLIRVSSSGVYTLVFYLAIDCKQSITPFSLLVGTKVILKINKIHVHKGNWSRPWRLCF